MRVLLYECFRFWHARISWVYDEIAAFTSSTVIITNDNGGPLVNYISGIQPGVRVPPGVREDILGGT
jgi:hypothetical protein